MTAVRNIIGMSKGTCNFAATHSLPQTFQPLQENLNSLHKVWADLRMVQNEAGTKPATWLHKKADAVAS